MLLIYVTNIAICHASIEVARSNIFPGWYRVHSWKEYKFTLNGAIPITMVAAMGLQTIQ